MLDVGDGQGRSWDKEGGVDLVGPPLHLLHQAHLVSLGDQVEKLKRKKWFFATLEEQKTVFIKISKKDIEKNMLK